MERVTSGDGTQIAFHRQGEGPALVLIGGAFCDHRARAAGLPLAALLRARFSVFCYDRRGRGESGDTPPHALAREVEDLAALLAAAGGSAFVYGHSSGAILALEAAAAGLPIRKLALYEPPLVLSEHRAPPPEDLVEQLEQLSAAGRRSEAVELFLSRAVALPEPALAHMKGGPAWPALEALAHTLSYDARIARDPAAVLARAASVTTPALLLDGERSPSWMRAGVRALARAKPEARHVSLPGQTHDVEGHVLAPVLSHFFQDAEIA